MGGTEFLNVIHMILSLKGLKTLKKFENVDHFVQLSPKPQEAGLQKTYRPH